MRALLLSTYDLGHQPFGLASPAAWLRRAGLDVSTVDLAKERLSDDVVRASDLIAFHLPMHTATRLAAPVIKRARALNPRARISCYGLYAPLNADWLRSLGANDVIGAEFEQELAAIAESLAGDFGVHRERGDGINNGDNVGSCSTAVSTRVDVGPKSGGRIPRLHFIVPDRSGLPALSRYATLTLADGSRRIAGYTEASRGCRHLCRHCPVVPVYNGQFRIVQPDVVLADIDTQVRVGAEHITFGDPDFLNGPRHAVRVVEALHAAYPRLTYDITVKIEHLLRHRDVLARLRDTGCLFVTSAVESLDDRVLQILDKGHTRSDFIEAVTLCRTHGITLVPTFVAFHPWLSLSGYCDLLDTIGTLELVDNVAPIQLAIRLLLPRGSRLLECEELGPFLQPFDPRTLAYPWVHRDPRVDRLFEEVVALVGARLTSDRREAFAEISALAHQTAGLPLPMVKCSGLRPPVPYIDEPWYCCAEPNPDQLRMV